MMHPSAFDEALALPFLSERTQKKKWSFASSTSTEVTMKSMLDYDDDEEDPFADLASEQEAEELIHTETITFGDDALIQERHGELMGINNSLKQINTIHQGKQQQRKQAFDRSWFQLSSRVEARMEGFPRFKLLFQSSSCCRFVLSVAASLSHFCS
jgi:hypothetical protein